MDTIPGVDPMENPPHAPLGGLDPANLLKQGVAEDTLMDGAATSFNPPPIEELTAIFPQFEIFELIGKGGMGAVYKVRQKDLDRIVALKILPPAIGRSPEFSNRFTREAKALAKLNHPGIVTLHEFGQSSSSQLSTINSQPLYYILMEFVDGVNLAQLMKAGRISPREALAIVPQICDALQFAHDQGIVHRDIKPENILLDRLGRVKVADFGIAKLAGDVTQAFLPDLHSPVASMLTEAGKIIGTPQYMAPEQIDHPSDVDHRADIYALGVVFYQMLTGELPGKRLEAPSKKVHIDVRLDEIVLRAMEKDPELRFQQASVMRTRVEDLGAESVDPDAAGKPVDSFAIAAFILGILSLVLWPFGFIPAIVFGHLSRSRIKTNPSLAGHGFATAGMVMGYAFLSLFVVMLSVFYLMRPSVSDRGLAGVSETAPRFSVLELHENGEISLEGKVVPPSRLDDELNRLIRRIPDVKLRLSYPPSAEYAKVRSLLESCTKAGIVNLEFAGSDLQAEGPSTVTVNILGAVGNPGAFQFRNGGSLLDVVAAAGGWMENGDLQRIQISVPAATEAQVHDLTAILSGKAVNPILQPGAVIEVSKK